MEQKLFNLEKIKEITHPIEELEGYTDRISKSYKMLMETYQGSEQMSSDEEYKQAIKPVLEKLHDIQIQLLDISKTNINKFLIFEDHLIQKYKDSFKENLKRMQLTPDLSKQIGLYLIENRKISTIISEATFIPSISLNQWLDLIDSLNQNSLFLSIIPRIRAYYTEIVEENLKQIIASLSEDTNVTLVEAYKKSYHKEPISFEEFLADYESKLTEEQLESKKELIKKTKEKEKLKQLQKKQEEQKQNFDDYFKYSQKEFQRMLRKKKRKKLSDISDKPDVQKEISEEVSEKIEKFKSTFEKKFDEDLFIKKDEDTNPLELIRERKRKKEEEYKDFIKKFDND